MSRIVSLKLMETEEMTRGPIIATFPQNIPPEYCLPNDGSKNDFPEKEISFELFKNSEDKKNNQNILLAKNEKFEWIGKNFGENSEKNQTSKYLVGTVSGNQLKLYPVNHVFTMIQHCLTDESYKKEETAGGSVTANLKAIEQKQLLVEEFGTKKSKKKMQQMLNNRVDEANISSSIQIKEILKEKAEILQVQADNEEKMEIENEVLRKKEFLPEFNVNAQVAKDIYDLHSIVSQEEWSELDVNRAQKLLKKKGLLEKEKKYFSEYVYDWMLNYNSDLNQKKNEIVKLKILYYMDCLIKAYHRNQYTKSVEEEAKELSIPLVIFKHIEKNFYQMVPLKDNGLKHIRPPILNDKLICHIVVLGLILNDFKMESGLLCVSLKIPQKKFVQYCKEIGCSVIVKDNTDFDFTSIKIELKAPLKFSLLPIKKGAGSKV